MSRRKEPTVPHELCDQLLAGGAASSAFDQGGLLDSLKKALTGRALKRKWPTTLLAPTMLATAGMVTVAKS